MSGAKLPLGLGAVLLVIFALTLFTTPEGKLNWLLEVGPGLVGMVALAVTWKRFPMTPMIYVFVFIHICILVYGGFYTYAKAPLGEWARVTFGWSRNNYDKIGHFAFGFFPVIVLREVLLRRTKLERNAWLGFLLLSTIMGFAAAYELFEWAAAIGLDPAGGDAFLGTQGDVWDAQSDMMFAGIGATLGLLLFSRAHDRALQKLLMFAVLLTVWNCGKPPVEPLDASVPEGPCEAVTESWPLEMATHVPGGSVISWQSNPPSSGSHFPAWAAFQEFGTPVPRGYYVHDLEHGAVVLLYNCASLEGGADGGACETIREGLRATAASLPSDGRCSGGVRARTVITPDPLLNDPVAAAAWGFTWRGKCVDQALLGAFVAAHYAHSPEDVCANGVTSF